ncbi:MAG: hypothetical protein JWN53_2044 [Gemmatimonadetes bacterium]|nr:hypothetical protein [Gemmatimonadota bacterium]
MRHLIPSVVLLAIASAASAQIPAPRPTGRALAGIPALNFDADEGAGYGALLQLYDYGQTGAAPYRYVVQPSVLLTTRGRRDVSLFVDAPHVIRGWRVSGIVASERQLAAPFYGVGNDTPQDETLTAGADHYYYRYGRDVVRGAMNAQHQLLQPALRLLVGVGAQRTVVHTVPFDSGTTLMAQQLGRGDLPARRSLYARLGLVWDTRDREIGTHEGSWAELIAQRSGSDEQFTRTTLTVRRYTPLGARVTFAQRLVAQQLVGDPSVTELATIQGSIRDDEALGGGGSLRGMPKNRYIGKGVAFVNNELRWDAAQFTLHGSPARVVLSSFVDAGRVWTDRITPTEAFSDLHVGYGGGIRLGVGPSFVVAADVGHSSQSMAPIYIGLGYLF